MASKLSDRQLDVLVKTVLGEARGEGVGGMEAVAQVIRNRANSGRYPSDPMAVALQPYQFSTWNKGEGGNNPQQFRPGTQAYETARQAVERVFSGDSIDPTNGALFYHTPQVNPSWAREVNRYGTTQIGNHIFYNGNPVPPRDIPNAVASQLDVTPPAVTGYPTALDSMMAARRNLQPSSIDNSFYQGIFNPADAPVDWSAVPASAGTPIGTVSTRPQVSGSMSYAGQERGEPTPYSARTIATVPTRQSVSGSMSYAGQDRGPRAIPSYSEGTTIATVPTRPQVSGSMSYAGQERATSTPYSAGRTIATIPTKPSVSGSMSYAGQERGSPTPYSARTIATVPTVSSAAQASAPKAVALSRDSVSRPASQNASKDANPNTPKAVALSRDSVNQSLAGTGYGGGNTVSTLSSVLNSPTQPASIPKFQDRLATPPIVMQDAPVLPPIAAPVVRSSIQAREVPLPRARPAQVQAAPRSMGGIVGVIPQAMQQAPKMIARAVAPIQQSMVAATRPTPRAITYNYESGQVEGSVMTLQA